jgi:hypothetical protein
MAGKEDLRVLGIWVGDPLVMLVDDVVSKDLGTLGLIRW